jgi:hypothetical protein
MRFSAIVGCTCWTTMNNHKRIEMVLMEPHRRDFYSRVYYSRVFYFGAWIEIVLREGGNRTEMSQNERKKKDVQTVRPEKVIDDVGEQCKSRCHVSCATNGCTLPANVKCCQHQSDPVRSTDLVRRDPVR